MLSMQPAESGFEHWKEGFMDFNSEGFSDFVVGLFKDFIEVWCGLSWALVIMDNCKLRLVSDLPAPLPSMFSFRVIPCSAEGRTSGDIKSLKCSCSYFRMRKSPKEEKQSSCYQKIWTYEDGARLKPCEPGWLMTKYHLRFDSMRHIMLAPAKCGVELRSNEKELLNELNMDMRLRFHVLDDKGILGDKNVQTRVDKIYVLINDCLTGDPQVHDPSMSQEIITICSHGCRVAKCMKEYFIHKKIYIALGTSSTVFPSDALVLQFVFDMVTAKCFGCIKISRLPAVLITKFANQTPHQPRNSTT